jgi:hypothetical protein
MKSAIGETSFVWPVPSMAGALAGTSSAESTDSPDSPTISGSTPGPIRTGDRRLRRPLLYPAELRAQGLRVPELGVNSLLGSGVAINSAPRSVAHPLTLSPKRGLARSGGRARQRTRPSSAGQGRVPFRVRSFTSRSQRRPSGAVVFVNEVQRAVRGVDAIVADHERRRVSIAQMARDAEFRVVAIAGHAAHAERLRDDVDHQA